MLDITTEQHETRSSICTDDRFITSLSGCFGNEEEQYCSQIAENGVAISFDDKMNILSTVLIRT